MLEKLGAKSFHKLRWVELEDDELAASEKGVATLASINTSYKRFVNYLEALRAKNLIASVRGSKMKFLREVPVPDNDRLSDLFECHYHVCKKCNIAFSFSPFSNI